MWPVLFIALGWVLYRKYEGKPILPDLFSRGFKSGASLAHISTPQGDIVVAIPNDTQVLSAGDPNGTPANVFTLGSASGSVAVTIPNDTPVAHPMAAADAGLLEPRALSLALALSGQSDLSIHAPRSLSSSTNPANPGGPGAGGGDAGKLVSALFGNLEPFDRYNGAGPNYEYTDDLDVPRSTSLSRIRFEAR